MINKNVQLTILSIILLLAIVGILFEVDIILSPQLLFSNNRDNGITPLEVTPTLRLESFVNIHIPKTGGSYFAKVLKSARPNICPNHSSSIMAKEYFKNSMAGETFPFNCGPIGYWSNITCGAHGTIPHHKNCFRDKRIVDMNPVFSRLNLFDHDIVTSVLVLRDPVDRFISEYLHTYRNKHWQQKWNDDYSSCSPWFDNPIHICQAFRHQNMSLLRFSEEFCISGYNRMTWMLSDHFQNIVEFANYCENNHRNQEADFEVFLKEAMINSKKISIVGTIQHASLVFEALTDVFGLEFVEKYNASFAYKRRQDQFNETIVNNIMNRGAYYDIKLYNSIFNGTKKTIVINWDSWFGKHLIELGLDHKYR